MYVYHTIYEALNMKNSTIKRKDFPKEHFKLEDPSIKAEKRTVAEFRVTVHYNVAQHCVVLSYIYRCHLDRVSKLKSLCKESHTCFTNSYSWRRNKYQITYFILMFGRLYRKCGVFLLPTISIQSQREKAENVCIHTCC